MKPAWSTTANFRPAVSEGYKQSIHWKSFSFYNSNTTAFLNLCFYIKASLNLTLNCSYMLIYCKKKLAFVTVHFTRKWFSFQPPSRNRRERAELRPDFFDSAAIIEDDSVNIRSLLLFIYTSLALGIHKIIVFFFFPRDLECLCSEVWRKFTNLELYYLELEAYILW